MVLWFIQFRSSSINNTCIHPDLFSWVISYAIHTLILNNCVKATGIPILHIWNKGLIIYVWKNTTIQFFLNIIGIWTWMVTHGCSHSFVQVYYSCNIRWRLLSQHFNFSCSCDTRFTIYPICVYFFVFVMTVYALLNWFIVHWFPFNWQKRWPVNLESWIRPQAGRKTQLPQRSVHSDAEHLQALSYL